MERRVCTDTPHASSSLLLPVFSFSSEKFYKFFISVFRISSPFFLMRLVGPLHQGQISLSSCCNSFKVKSFFSFVFNKKPHLCMQFRITKINLTCLPPFVLSSSLSSTGCYYIFINHIILCLIKTKNHMHRLIAHYDFKFCQRFVCLAPSGLLMFLKISLSSFLGLVSLSTTSYHTHTFFFLQCHQASLPWSIFECHFSILNQVLMAQRRQSWGDPCMTFSSSYFECSLSFHSSFSLSRRSCGWVRAWLNFFFILLFYFGILE